MKTLFIVVACFLSVGMVSAKPIPQPPRQDKAGKPRTLINPARDLAVLSDRDESIVAYFNRQKLMVASMLPRELTATLEGKSAGKKVFVNYSSYNTEPKSARFGSNVVIDTPAEPVVRLLRDAIGKHPDRQFALIFRLDEKNADQVSIVGYVFRSSVSFFDNGKRVPPDDFSPRDLAYQNAKAP